MHNFQFPWGYLFILFLVVINCFLFYILRFMFLDLKESKNKASIAFKIIYIIYFSFVSLVAGIVVIHQSNKYLVELDWNFDTKIVSAKDNYMFSYQWDIHELSHWELRNLQPIAYTFDPEERGVIRDYPKNSDSMQLYLVLKNHERYSIAKWDKKDLQLPSKLIEDSGLVLLDTRDRTLLFDDPLLLSLLTDRGLSTVSQGNLFDSNVKPESIESLTNTQDFYVKTENRKEATSLLASYMKNTSLFFEIVKLAAIPVLIFILFYIVEFFKRKIISKILPSLSKKFGWDGGIKSSVIFKKKLFIYVNLVVGAFYIAWFLAPGKILEKDIQISIKQSGFIHSNRQIDDELAEARKTLSYWTETFFSNPMLFIHRLGDILETDFYVKPKFYTFSEIHNLEFQSSLQGEFHIVIRDKAMFRGKDEDKKPEIIVWDSMDPLVAEYLSYRLERAY
ncbi:MAG: hypothetical protein JJT78_15630 [Leptospira sp.]|nr:hypothetical protein [Leptospira sp.]